MRNFRRYFLWAAATAGAILWGIFFVPHFIDRGQNVRFGNNCFVEGHRDPVTGRTYMPLGSREPLSCTAIQEPK